MASDAMIMMAVGIALAFIRVAASAPCQPVTVSLSVATAAGLQYLRDAMDFSGKAVFDVAWNSNLRVEQRIDVTDYKTVRVTGTCHHTDGNGVPGSEDTGGVISGGYTTGIFLVSNRSSLTKTNLVSEGRYSDGERAIAVHSSSFLYVSRCAFVNNTASIGGKNIA